MKERFHEYRVNLAWTGNLGSGTRDYRGYDRSHSITAPGKPMIPGSSDRSFRGDATRWNPEELLVASLAACHKLWFLALCAQAGVCVTAYRDQARGEMREESDGAGQFTFVVLRPEVRLATGDDEAMARDIHERAHAKCFIARSVNFSVRIEPTFVS
ncbi:OsmC family protein [Sphingomonas sp.]|jgi:organic hydroperoxide reductase OsmC/OhrA|uniref:OsmC family protein n=1 Tax=Sphingomonas sp. TaxID=28214 RepID=UPI002DE2960B|nr:OsmC family protein [Sphingomonas sp.]